MLQLMTRTMTMILALIMISGCDTLQVNPSQQDCKLRCEDCKGVEFECAHEGGGGQEVKSKGRMPL